MAFTTADVFLANIIQDIWYTWKQSRRIWKYFLELHFARYPKHNHRVMFIFQMDIQSLYTRHE
ncbi:hypothetical protein UYSO10_5035 [Kosakonia radicincitans]|nr:hypothetical protein UYSO10_5035 [Kosakonia radicincitans]